MRRINSSKRLTTKRTPVDAGVALRAGAEVELAFTDLLANGQAVGRSAGMVVFCFGPLPAERARVRITAVKPKYAVASLVALTVRSAVRAQPFCPVFGECGGCQVQHLSYPSQLAWKRDVVVNALARIGGFDSAVVHEPIGMINPRAYRNKMSLVVSKGSLGFYRQRSHDVVAIDGCPIVMPQLNDHIGRLNEMAAQPKFAGVFARALHIVERTAKATQQTIATITTADPSKDLAQAGPEIVQRLPGTVGLSNSFGLSSANAILGRKHRPLAGKTEIEEQIDGIRYRVSPGSFFQVNVEIVRRIFDYMRAGLNAPRKIVDLYCGAGTFAVYFAKLGSSVLGIEENSLAVAEARKNAALNELSGSARFITGRVEEALKHGEARSALKAADIAFLDPPRKGSDEAALDAIAQSHVPNIWYLSCDPATLARDLKFLAAKGYDLGVVQPFDMFPQTGHIETLATMYRRNESARNEIEEAFKDAPVPHWPSEEYPEFVVS